MGSGKAPFLPVCEPCGFPRKDLKPRLRERDPAWHSRGTVRPGSTAGGAAVAAVPGWTRPEFAGEVRGEKRMKAHRGEGVGSEVLLFLFVFQKKGRRKSPPYPPFETGG